MAKEAQKKTKLKIEMLMMMSAENRAGIEILPPRQHRISTSTRNFIEL
jgi:hypothetical protein